LKVNRPLHYEQYPGKYDGILAWRVLVHFTPEDFPGEYYMGATRFEK
jgi:hypothetical protein